MRPPEEPYRNTLSGHMLLDDVGFLRQIDEQIEKENLCFMKQNHSILRNDVMEGLVKKAAFFM